MPLTSFRTLGRALRTALFWTHLAVGVLVAIVVVIMSATGVLLTYQKQMTRWADLRAMPAVSAPARGGTRLPAADLIARARAAVPDPAPTAITWRAAAAEPVEVAFGRERHLFLDPHTGAVLGEGSRRMRGFFRTTTDLHRWLGAKDERRAFGKSITGAANLGFLFLVLSGAILWWPRNLTRAAVRGVLLFRRGLSPKARDFNWHNVVGVWSVLPLATIVASGVVISYPWAGDLVYRAAGDTPPPRVAAEAPRAATGGPRSAEGTPGALVGVDAALARAEARMPGWRGITMPMPRSAEAPMTFALDAGTGGQPQRRASLTFDRATGAETTWEPFAAQGTGRRWRSVLRFAHTGEVLGIAGQTVAGLVSMGALLLAWTGCALTWRRLRGALQRREPRADRVAARRTVNRAA